VTLITSAGTAPAQADPLRVDGEKPPVHSWHSPTHLKRSLRRGRFSFANCSAALRSSSGSVRCIKHNYPDHHDKSERQKRGQRHKFAPRRQIMDRVIEHICDGHHSGSVTITASPITAPSEGSAVHSVNLGPL